MAFGFFRTSHSPEVKSNYEKGNQNSEASLHRALFVTPVATMLRMAIGIQPGQKAANAAVGQSNA